jgi:hypothetical protein
MKNGLFFNGGGLNFIWYLGLINSIDKTYLENYSFYGISGGAISIALYLCKIDLVQIFDNFLKIKKNDEFNLKYILNNLDKLLYDVLPDNCHLLCKNKLNIIYWKIGYGNQIINNFTSKKHLISSLINTSKLPFTLKNIKEIYNNLIMDPLFINLNNINLDCDNILQIGFTIDKNCSPYDSFYIYNDFKEYIKKYYYGYNFGLENIIYENNIIKLK